MPRSTKLPPGRSKKVFLEWFERVRGEEKRKRVFRGRYSKGRASSGAARVFVLSMHDLIRGRGAVGARFLGWRHFGDGQNTPRHVSADVITSRRDHVLGRIYDRESTMRLVRILRTIRRKYMKSRRYCDVRLLRVPPLMSLAVWIRARKLKDDLVLPVESCLIGVKETRAYRFSDVLPVLHTSAKTLGDQSGSVQSRLQQKESRSRREA